MRRPVRDSRAGDSGERYFLGADNLSSPSPVMLIVWLRTLPNPGGCDRLGCRQRTSHAGGWFQDPMDIKDYGHIVHLLFF